MRISQAKQSIKELYLNTRHVTALISERGVGKTSAYRQCAEELGIDYMALYAAALEGPDFMGLPDKSGTSKVTRYLAPQFLPTLEAVEEGIFQERGILVLEEINRVPSDTVSVLYPLLLEGRINQHRLAPGWRIGVTMNPDSLNYSVNALDDALIDRFIAMEIQANLTDYLAYSQKGEFHGDVLDFLTSCPDMLLVTKASTDSNPLDKNPTPRGWTRVQEILNRCDLPKDLMEQLLGGILGPMATAAFYGFLNQRNQKIPGAEETLGDYQRSLVHYEELFQENRYDLINQALGNLAEKVRPIPRHMENLNALLEGFPEEMSILFFKQLATKRQEDFAELSEAMPLFDQLADKMVDMLSH